MDFFDSQERAKRRTGLLVVLLLLAVVVISALVYTVLLPVFFYYGVVGFDAEMPFWNQVLRPDLMLFVGGGVLLFVMAGSLYRVFSLRDGSMVASYLGGRPGNLNTTNPHERQLLNVVDEMAIASGCPPPSVFVLSGEKSINAFAAGYSPTDAVIVVTRGAMEKLDRDELQGVIAHEFSHIMHGDMKLNVRLMGVLHGILLIGIVGRVLVGAMFFGAGSGSHSRRRDSRDNGVGALPILALGIALLAIGYVGTFFGRMIKAAISRQREFLADAAAVQFTRNPEGIAGALKKIGGHSGRGRIHNSHAEEASHFFFANALWSPSWNPFSTSLATHPPLEKRIKAVDPSWDGEFPKVIEYKPLLEKMLDHSHVPQPNATPPPVQPIQQIRPQEAVAAIGAIPLQAILLASQMVESWPQQIRAAVRDERGAQAVVYLLLLDRDEAARRAQIAVVESEIESGILQQALSLQVQMQGIGDEQRLPLLELCLPALRELQQWEADRLLEDAERLVRADEKTTLFEFVLTIILMRHLDAQLRVPVPFGRQAHGLALLLPAVGVVLSALAHAGQRDAKSAELAFKMGRERLKEGRAGSLELLPRESCSLERVGNALIRLRTMAPRVKKEFIDAAAHVVLADEEVQLKEAELLRAVCEVLDCPMPPVVQERTGKSAPDSSPVPQGGWARTRPPGAS